MAAPSCKAAEMCERFYYGRLFVYPADELHVWLRCRCRYRLSPIFFTGQHVFIIILIILFQHLGFEPFLCNTHTNIVAGCY